MIEIWFTYTRRSSSKDSWILISGWALFACLPKPSIESPYALLLISSLCMCRQQSSRLTHWQKLGLSRENSCEGFPKTICVAFPFDLKTRNLIQSDNFPSRFAWHVMTLQKISIEIESLENVMSWTDFSHFLSAFRDGKFSDSFLLGENLIFHFYVEDVFLNTLGRLELLLRVNLQNFWIFQLSMLRGEISSFCFDSFLDSSLFMIFH